MERLSVYMCLKRIKMEGKYGKFVSAGYQSIQYFKMANEQDLAILTLNSEEIEVFRRSICFVLQPVYWSNMNCWTLT